MICFTTFRVSYLPDLILAFLGLVVFGGFVHFGAGSWCLDWHKTGFYLILDLGVFVLGRVGLGLVGIWHAGFVFCLLGSGIC